jgi:hypothetical protein
MVRNWVDTNLLGVIIGLKDASRREEKEDEDRRTIWEKNAIEFKSFRMLILIRFSILG